MSIDCLYCLLFFFFKQKTAYEMRISDWSSDVCSSDLGGIGGVIDLRTRKPLDFDGFELSGSVRGRYETLADKIDPLVSALVSDRWNVGSGEMGLLLTGSYQERRSEEHTSELQSLMRISYAVFCLKKKQTADGYKTRNIAV